MLKFKKLSCALIAVFLVFSLMSSIAFADGDVIDDGIEAVDMPTEIEAPIEIERPVITEEFLENATAEEIWDLLESLKQIPVEPFDFEGQVIPENILEYATAEELEEMLEISREMNIPVEIIPICYDKYMHIICRPYTGKVNYGEKVVCDETTIFSSRLAVEKSESKTSSETETQESEPKIQNIDAFGIHCVVTYEEGVVYTPNGTSVDAIFYLSDLLPALKTAINNNIASIAPRAVRLGEPTITYNCHSYAWYYGDCWIDDPQDFYLDHSYDEVSSPQPGDIVYYAGGDHSGVVYSISDSGNIVVQSKWGMSGLYCMNSAIARTIQVMCIITDPIRILTHTQI